MVVSVEVVGDFEGKRKRKKRLIEEAEPAALGEQTKKGFAKIGDKQFALPEGEIRRLQSQGDLPGGLLEKQAAQRRGEDLFEAAVGESREELREAGAFEEVTPGEVSLLPTSTIDVPGLGAGGAGVAQAVASAIEKEIAGEVTGEAAFPKPLGLETIREEALREVSIKSFDEGVSRSEAFASFVEAIPLIGNRARAWAGGLLESPSKNADSVISEIAIIKEAASTGQEKVRNGLEDPDFGLDNARSMEEEIAKLEGRLRILIETSPVLRANTDEINRIQEDILSAKVKVSRYRRASAFGYTAQLTGAGRPIPTDEQIFFELQRLENEGTT